MYVCTIKSETKRYKTKLIKKKKKMKTNYEKPKWTDKWGYIKSIKLETNLVCIEQNGGWMTYEQFGGWNTKQGGDKALSLYNSIINN